MPMIDPEMIFMYCITRFSYSLHSLEGSNHAKNLSPQKPTEPPIPVRPLNPINPLNHLHPKLLQALRTP